MIAVLKTLFSARHFEHTAAKLALSDEQKVDNYQALVSMYEPFKLAQRYLALFVVLPWSTACFATFIASFFTDVSQQQAILSSHWGIASGLIIAFYFGGGAARSIVNKGKS